MSLISTINEIVDEAMGSLAHKIFPDSTIHRELNDAIIPTPDGAAQIDHISPLTYDCERRLAMMRH